MTTAPDAAREAARRPSGQFGVQPRAEAPVGPDGIDLSLVPDAGPVPEPVDDLDAMSREELLRQQALRGVPAAWTDPHTDDTLREIVRDARRREADMARATEAAEVEKTRRRSYRRPSWLHMEKANDQRRYSTDDGYTATEYGLAQNGGMSTIFTVTAPDGTETSVERVELIAQWIGKHRHATAGAWPEGRIDDFDLDRLDSVIAGDVDYYLGHTESHGAYDEDFALGRLDPSLVLDSDRFEAMRHTLDRDGVVREPLSFHVYPDGRVVLRDGHHRYFAARAVGIDTVPADFHHAVPDPDEASGWAFPTDEAW